MTTAETSPLPGVTASFPDLAESDLNQLIDSAMTAALAALDGPAPLVDGMARYHLGQVDADFAPNPDERAAQGKRMRPAIALLTCEAAGGAMETAAPLAAAVELLHNFTLVHDDIQDQSPTRRHRPTVWSVWGIAQAINAGDALFAAAHIALYQLRYRDIDDGLILNLSDAFDRMTLSIVAGQALDLQFEERDDVSPDEYLTMIAGKTAAIVRYAAWGGALLAGADDERANDFAAFGQALGFGFQIRDDILGIWGTAADTGKEADDIRRRKQSLPILVLRSRAGAADSAELRALYRRPEINDQGAARVRALLTKYGVREIVERQVAEYHDQARTALLAATGSEPVSARETLLTTVESLALRSS
jgi:geranylgeranyl diphosphate synthase type I